MREVWVVETASRDVLTGEILWGEWSAHTEEIDAMGSAGELTAAINGSQWRVVRYVPAEDAG